MTKILICLLSACLFIGCNYTKRFSKNVYPDSIPADITNENYILLLQKQGTTTKQTRYDVHENRLAEKQMKKYYKWRYEFAFENDIKNDPKYADVNIYRYVFTRSPLSESVGSSYSTGSKTYYRNLNDDFIFDRKQNEKLDGISLLSNSFAQGTMIFAKVLNYRAKKVKKGKVNFISQFFLQILDCHILDLKDLI